MIEYIKGEIAELSPATAVIDCNGLGYAVNISLNTYSAIQGCSNIGKRFELSADKRNGSSYLNRIPSYNG